MRKELMLKDLETVLYKFHKFENLTLLNASHYILLECKTKELDTIQIINLVYLKKTSHSSINKTFDNAKLSEIFHYSSY